MNMAALSFGITPFPNDTFLFHALAEGITALPAGLKLSVASLEELNRRALSGRLDVGKISANILPHLLDEYVILRAGASLGHGCGPIVVSSNICSLEEIDGKLLATPGKLTTAHLLLSLNGSHSGPYLTLHPEQILPAVSSGQVEAGIVIHEERSVAERFGLHLIVDLGSWWEAATGLPLPLAVMVMRRSFGNDMHLAMEKSIRESLQRAQEKPEASRTYIRNHAKTMDAELISGLIRCYINEFSSELGPEGEAAVKALIKRSLSFQGASLAENVAFFPAGN